SECFAVPREHDAVGRRACEPDRISPLRAFLDVPESQRAIEASGNEHLTPGMKGQGSDRSLMLLTSRGPKAAFTHVPKPDRSIPACSRQGLAVWRESDGKDQLIILYKGLQAATCKHIPELDFTARAAPDAPVACRGSQKPPVRGVGDPPNPRCV